MNRESKNTRTMRENERNNEGGREYGHIHQPSQTQEATNRRGLADDAMPDSRQRGQAPGPPRQVESRRGSGTQQSRPPGNMGQGRKRERHGEKKAA